MAAISSSVDRKYINEIIVHVKERILFLNPNTMYVNFVNAIQYTIDYYIEVHNTHYTLRAISTGKAWSTL